MAKAIAAHCKSCGQAVTCTGDDDAEILTGRCDKCGALAEVKPYTPVPFKGGELDPRAPLMAAHVVSGPGGEAEPVIATAGNAHTEGLLGYGSEYQGEPPVEGEPVEPAAQEPVVTEPEPYAPVESEPVENEPVITESVTTEPVEPAAQEPSP